MCCPRDCVSRHNGGTSGAPLKPLRVDSALRAQSSLRGSRGAPEVPPLCRETQSLGQQILNAPVGINGLIIVLSKGGDHLPCVHTHLPGQDFSLHYKLFSLFFCPIIYPMSEHRLIFIMERYIPLRVHICEPSSKIKNVALYLLWNDEFHYSFLYANRPEELIKNFYRRLFSVAMLKYTCVGHARKDCK